MKRTCLNCGCELTPCDTPAECQSCIDNSKPTDTVESLQAENKRLEAEVGRYKKVYEAAKTIPTTAALEMEASGMTYSCKRVANTIEACVECAADEETEKEVK